MIGRGELKSNPITIHPTQPKIPGPEHNIWFWHPGRIGVRFAPSDFRRRLQEIDPELDVTWNPIIERWTVWMKKPSLQTPICQGWGLLFVVKEPNNSYRPLDERIFARLYEASTRKWSNAKTYFAAVEREIEREKELKSKRSTQDAIDIAMPSFEHSQIKVGYGKSSGSKFSTYHS